MRRRIGASRPAAALVACALGLGCGSVDSLWSRPPPIRGPVEPAPPTQFSGERAFSYLEALTAIGPRVAGTPGADAAREYIRAQLEGLGLTVREHAFAISGESRSPVSAPPAAGSDADAPEEPAATEDADAPVEPAAEGADMAPGSGGESDPLLPDDAGADEATAPVEIVHLSVVIPGASSDVFLLAAHFDTARFEAFRFVGANDGASGPAVLLELARQLSERPLPYTTWIAFLDGEARFDDAVEPFAGSRALAAALAADGTLDRVRLAVFFGAVGDAELTVARDARSYRRYRETFFEVGHRLGYEQAFPRSSPATDLDGSHVAFLAARTRRVVLIADDRFGGDEPPGLYWHTEDDTPAHCSPESLASIGHVTLIALRQIGSLLQKVDRFVKRPSPEPATEAAQDAEGVGEADEGASEGIRADPFGGLPPQEDAGTADASEGVERAPPR